MAAYQALLSTGFARQEHWSGLPFPSPGDRPDPGIKPRSPTLQADSLPSEPQSAPGLVFADCIECLHLWLQIYNQSDFSVDHLAMAMCRVVFCGVERVCLL